MEQKKITFVFASIACKAESCMLLLFFADADDEKYVSCSLTFAL